jgi:maltose alpha-D-glucosyltransferase/alpha-amylase
VTGDARALLESALAAYLVRRPWYAGGARSLRALEISHASPLDAGRDQAYVMTVEAHYQDGLRESYWLPVALVTGKAMESMQARAPEAVIAAVREERRGKPRIGLLIDALSSDGFCAALFDLVRKGRGLRGRPARRLKGSRLEWFCSEASREALPCRLVAESDTHTSIACGDGLRLSVLRRIEPGVHPEVEIGRLLSEVPRFSHSPRLAGWLEYLAGDGLATVAVLREAMPGSRDAFGFAREEVARYFDRALARGDGEVDAEWVPPVKLLDDRPPALAAELIGGFLGCAELLGRRIAELHRVLADASVEPAFAPEPYDALHQHSVYQSLRNLALRAIRGVTRRSASLSAPLQALAQRFAQSEAALLAKLEGFAEGAVRVVRMRHHGDFHLGRVLHTGRDFALVEFGGEPSRTLAERRRKRCALRDVAAMLRSFHYACASARLEHGEVGSAPGSDPALLERWSGLWQRWASWAFLRAYLDTCGSAAFVPSDRGELERLLDVFLLERALLEVVHELEQRPAWLGIPLQGIAQILGAGQGRVDAPA